MSLYDKVSNDFEDEILSDDRESQSDTEFFEDEIGINIEDYSSNDVIDEDVPGSNNQK